MSIFKKTIKYSKSSKDLDNKIKNLDEGLKQTGVIKDDGDSEYFSLQENVVNNHPQIYDEIEVIPEEEQLYNWRETLLENFEEEQISLIKSTEEINHSLTRVENYISKSNKELILLRDQVFQEISESTLLNLPEIKDKISRVLEIYEQLQEGLLNEPPETQNEDPLTPLNQNFVTTEDLNKHYTLFINRIQEQLATLGGGGETQLKYLDDIVGIATNASAYDGKFLKYDHSVGKFVFDTAGGGAGSQTLNQTLGYGNTSSLGMSVGVITATGANITGNATLGANSSSLINVPGRISSNFYPNGDGVYDLGRAPQIGSGANRWKDANFYGKGTFDGGVDAHDLELGVSSSNLIYSTSGNLELNSQSGTTNIDDKVTISGNTGIGTANPTSKLHVVGNANISGIITTTSINFYSGGLLGDPYEDGGFGLKSSTTGNQYAIVASNNLQQYIQVDNNTIYIGTGYGSTTGSYNWAFKKDGSTEFPNSLILAPVSQNITLQSDQYTQLMWMNADQSVTPNKSTHTDFYVETGGATLDIAYRDGAGYEQIKSWTWYVASNNGDYGFRFPDSTVQTTAFTGYANNAGIATYAQTSGVSTSVIGGIASVTSLNVTGLSTFTGISTFQSTLFGTQLNVSGVGTFNTSLQLGINGSSSGSLTINSSLGSFSNTSISPGSITFNNSGATSISLNGNNQLYFRAGSNGASSYLFSNYYGGFDHELFFIDDYGNTRTSGNANISGITTTQRLNVGTGGTVITTTSNGLVGIGTANPTSKLHVVGDSLITGIATVGLGTTSTPPSNSQMSFELISNTNLRIKVRGTDGVLRSANITLA